MSEAGKPAQKPLSLRPHLIAMAATWTAIIAAAVILNSKYEHRQIHEFVRTRARAAFNQDVVYRSWNASHGGVYVPATESTPPNPHLAQLAERDLVTPSGRLLTLVNPAYMTRQVHELGREQFGVRAHITSLKPIRSANAADAWETKALGAFEHGAPEVSSIEQMDGEPYLRLMRPLLTEASCLKCHASQGYHEGEVRGGISVSTPLRPYYAATQSHVRTEAIVLALLWVAGLGGIHLVTGNLRRRVNERLGMKEALGEKTVLLDNILRSASDNAIVTTDLQYRVTYYNPMAEKLFGCSATEVVGRSLAEAPLHTMTPEWFEHAVEVVRRKGRYQGELTRESGEETRRLDVCVAGILDRDDVLVGFSLFCRDVTERRRAEAALRESEAQVRLLLNSTAEAIYGLDLDGRCTLCNPACLRMLGYASSDQVLGSDMHQLIHHTRADGTPHPKEDCRAYRALQHGEKVHADDEILWRADGTSFPVEYWAYPIRHEGKTAGAVVTFLDITERKQTDEVRRKLEAQLRQSQKLEAVGHLAGGVAHDFNNILTSIVGNTELAIDELRTDFAEADVALAGLAEVQKSAQRASILTKQLLTFSRQDIAQPRSLNLNSVLEGLDNMLRCVTAENITLEKVTAPDLACVQADANQVEQVIINLVANAAQAMPDGGRLIVETRNVTLDEDYAANHAEAQPGAHVVLLVSDTGCGMDAATQERIFEPFFTTKPVDKGTGLGLATVHGIVKQTGGHVAVYSELGRGTTFRVYLPATDSVSPSQTPVADSDAPLHGDEHVLLCEDDPAVRRLVTQSLHSAGYRVLTADRAEAALAAAEAHAGPLDLLITDVILPDLNGRALSEQMSVKFPGLSTLFISGYSADVIAHHGVLGEGIRFLEKPFTRRSLLIKVREVLEEKAPTA